MDLVESLRILGDNPDAVATTLQAKGIKGRPRKSEACPVAQYLESCGFQHVAVGLNKASIGRWETYQDEEMPEAVQQFISRFDAGNYQFLRWI